MIETPSARYTEIETGAEITIFAPYTWGSAVQTHYVARYPSGREYVVTREQVDAHFELIPGQTVSITSLVVDQRPTRAQMLIEHPEATA
jgi:hypothetical protein